MSHRRHHRPLPSAATAPPTVLDSDDESSVFREDEVDSQSVATFDARRHFEVCYGDAVASKPIMNHRPSNINAAVMSTDNRGAAISTAFASDTEHESDEEIMNPYVMNPFSRGNSSAYDMALLPPSMELPQRVSQQQQGEGLQPSQARYRKGQNHMTRFDPYSPAGRHAQELTDTSSGQGDALEMEEEIDFFTDSTPVHSIKALYHVRFSAPSSTAAAARRNTHHHGESSPLSGATNSYTNTFASYSSRTLSPWEKIRTILFGISNPFTRDHSFAKRRNRMKFSHFRMLLLIASIFIVISTVGTMRRVIHALSSSSSSSDGNSSDSLGYEKRPDSLVLKKMETAKKRWWRKNGKKSKNELPIEEEEEQQHENVAQHPITVQQQESVSSNVQQPQQENLHQHEHKIDVQQSIDLVKHNVSNATHGILENANFPLVIEEGEDGSLLIKLPPPKMGLEQPVVMKNDKVGASAFDAPGKDDDAVYIKLPYQQTQRRSLSTKAEVDPPLRGVSLHDHTNLQRRMPSPLELNSKYTHSQYNGEHHPALLDTLRKEFGSWMKKHGKQYQSSEEKERRFHIWKSNHFRISEKNEKHGPCRMTGKAVFGHNIFSDLEPEEFQNKYLTGYRGPQVHDHEAKVFRMGQSSSRGITRRYKSEEMEPPSFVSIHPSIQRKLEEEDVSTYGTNLDDYKSKYYQYRNKFANDCDWWDVSCMLQWMFGYQYMGGTREPVFDESTYPDALDWRNMGVVSSVHAQGSCGACWAITAVETIESAHAIQTGDLLDLAEEEVIACDGTCDMCNGGWPQNAYKYVMKHGGLPVKNVDYDGDFLYYLTATLTGESENVSEDDMNSYFAQTCPAGIREHEGGTGGGSGSRDNGDGSNSDSTRYGSIKGYGYATERCVCYTDGSGCDCDEQDEQKAVLNIASYGPAAVCLEASLWQNYEGGIMTSDTGCGSAFLDMNHCVQVVGYAFTTSSNNGDDGSRDNGGSRDGGKREGYWIVKNQWSNYWGMNGYAYLAMGENTCGILNDMTQVYM